ncbi:hypothetical protein D6817_01870, partial [Candidatus Pacearchaeota archaeon]
MRTSAPPIAFAIFLLLSQFSTATQPKFELTQNTFYACEDAHFEERLSVLDVDEDLDGIAVFPSDKFFLEIEEQSPYQIIANLVSLKFQDSDAGKAYNLRLSAVSASGASEENVEVRVLRKNDAPQLSDIPDLTLAIGESEKVSVFYSDEETPNEELKLEASLVEQSSSTGGLEVKLAGSNAGIGEGEIEVSARETGSYEVRVCVSDKGLASENEWDGAGDVLGAFCNASTAAQSTCKNFKVLVVGENTPPEIIAVNPKNEKLKAKAFDKIAFSVSARDKESDELNFFWYLNGKPIKFEKGEVSTFNRVFSCLPNLENTITAYVSDGEFVRNVSWYVDLDQKSCAEERVECEPRWVCTDWGVCEELSKALEIESLTKDDGDELMRECAVRSLEGRRCGYQIRNCYDLNACNSSAGMPSTFQACEFTPEPSCSDGKQNCHDGGCELRADCGGPCGVEKCTNPDASNRGFLKIILIVTALVVLLILAGVK